MGTGWDDTEVHCLITSWQRPLLTWELYKHHRYTKYDQGLPSINRPLPCGACCVKPSPHCQSTRGLTGGVYHRVLPPAANGSNRIAPNLTDAPSPYIPPPSHPPTHQVHSYPLWPWPWAAVVATRSLNTGAASAQCWHRTHLREKG